MGELIIINNEVDKAISIMREVAAWGRNQGYKVWLDEWLTKELLLTEEAQPENFYIGILDDKKACSFILQWNDKYYWPDAMDHEAAYLHKFCVRREFAHMGMTMKVVECIKVECRKRDIRYIRLDTGYNQETVKQIYLDSGFKIVRILNYENGRTMALYEMEV